MKKKDLGDIKVLKKELADLVLEKNMKKLKDLKACFKKRKEIAKVLTIMGQKKTLEQLKEVSK